MTILSCNQCYNLVRIEGWGFIFHLNNLRDGIRTGLLEDFALCLAVQKLRFKTIKNNINCISIKLDLIILYPQRK